MTELGVDLKDCYHAPEQHEMRYNTKEGDDTFIIVCEQCPQVCEDCYAASMVAESTGGTWKKQIVIRKYRKITLCGSTKFKKEYHEWNIKLTLEGNVVYSVASMTHTDKNPITDEQKELLDWVHKRKIDESDEIFVLDVDGYIGESTRSEIEYAEKKGKKVYYLSDGVE